MIAHLGEKVHGDESELWNMSEQRGKFKPSLLHLYVDHELSSTVICWPHQQLCRPHSLLRLNCSPELLGR